MKIILIAIILMLIATIAYTGSLNTKVLNIIISQQSIISNQQKVIDKITGMTDSDTR